MGNAWAIVIDGCVNDRDDAWGQASVATTLERVVVMIEVPWLNREAWAYWETWHLIDVVMERVARLVE